MKETIHYISDFEYLTVSNHTKVINHIKYITRKGDMININIKDWKEKIKIERNKRKDSRVMLRFVVALPNIESNIAALKLIELIKSQFHIPSENIGMVIHKDIGISGKINTHAHIVIYPRNIYGKKIRINKNDLREFHFKWDQILNNMDFVIIKDSKEFKQKHIGIRIRYDKKIKAQYFKYLRKKEIIRKKEKKLKEMILDMIRKSKKPKSKKNNNKKRDDIDDIKEISSVNINMEMEI